MGMVRALRSARKWGQRPTEFLGVRYGWWTSVDAQLAQALDEYEATRVDEFGYPKWLSEGDTEGWFEVELRQNNARLALDQWRRDQKDGGQPGMEPHVIYTGEWPSAGQ